MLCQIDSADALGWSWGDGEMLYVMAPTEDVFAGRLDRAQLILQCC